MSDDLRGMENKLTTDRVLSIALDRLLDEWLEVAEIITREIDEEPEDLERVVKNKCRFRLGITVR